MRDSARGVCAQSHEQRRATATSQRGARGCYDATGRGPGELRSGWGTWFDETGTRGEPARGRGGSALLTRLASEHSGRNRGKLFWTPNNTRIIIQRLQLAALRAD